MPQNTRGTCGRGRAPTPKARRSRWPGNRRAPSPQRMVSMTKQIPLTQGQTALVDDEDFEWLSQWKWCAQYVPSTANYYAIRNGLDENGACKRLYMHRLILAAQSSQEVDHINHRTTDNRHANLRLCSRSQNQGNQEKQRCDKSSCFKGVSWCKHNQKWRATIKCHGCYFHLGWFTDELIAALAYNCAALEYFGEYAFLNGISNERVTRLMTSASPEGKNI